MGWIARTLSLLLFVALLAPVRAGAQAVWTDTGEVAISVQPIQGGFVMKSAEDVLPSDVVVVIEIGDSGTSIIPPSNGSVSIRDEGTEQSPRTLGDVILFAGRFDLENSFVTGIFNSGTPLGTNGVSVLAVVDSEIRNDGRDSLVLQVGRSSTIECQGSYLEDLRMRNSGVAQLDGCDIGTLDTEASTVVSATGGTFERKSHDLTGTVTLNGVTGQGSATDVFDGEVAFHGVVWTDTSGFDAETIAAPLTFTVRESTITTRNADFLGQMGRAVDALLADGTIWTDTGGVRIGTSGPFGLQSGARLQIAGDLDVSRDGTAVTVSSDVGGGARLDVGGNAVLQTAAVVNVEDGGVVDVDGTLTISAGATVNLNGGLLRVSNLVNQGTLAENGGALVVPEPGALGSAALAAATLGFRVRRRKESTRLPREPQPRPSFRHRTVRARTARKNP